MSHTRYEEWLAVYSDLGAAERGEVAAHLGRCAACAALLGDYRRVHEALRSRPAPRPSARLCEGFAAAVAQAQARRAAPWARLGRAVLALGNAAVWVTVAAVAALLVLSIALTAPQLARRAWPATQPTATPAVLPTATAQLTATPNATATATPARGPAVAVARLERLQGLCCPPRFAPDGRTYLTVDQGHLRLGTLDGGPLRDVPLDGERPGGAAFSVGNAVWTPGGTAIVVTQGAPTGIPAPLYLVAPKSGAARPLGETYTPWRLLFDARRRLVVGTQTGYQALDLDSGAAAEIPGVAPRDATGVETELAFSPDGRAVAALQGTELAIVDLETGQKTPITITTTIHPQWRACFAWSTDGRQLAYATGARGAAPELWVANADGSGARRLVTREGDRGGAYAGLAWLPNTPYIVYEYVPDSDTATLQGEYYVISTEGGPAKMLFTNGLGLALSPDGRVISFTRDLQGAEETGNWIAVLEYGEAGGPATPVPTPTAVAGTPTPAPPLITPVVTGASVAVSGWSPDGEWLAFWRAAYGAPAQPYPAMALSFYNARTGETCDCPEIQTKTTTTRPLPLAWQDDGQVVVWDGTRTMRGRPCQGSFQAASDVQPPADAVPAEALSPGGSYRATTVEAPSDGTQMNVTTTLADARSDAPLQTVSYLHRGGLGSLGLGGAWVTDSLFLIRETLDRGPLLVDVKQGRVIEVLSELFGISQTPTLDLGFWAEAATVAGGESYHIVLGGVGIESLFPPLRLYHSESGQVETLEFKYPGTGLFSSDGHWLLLDAQTYHPCGPERQMCESYDLWTRPVDPAGSSAHLLADGRSMARWSADWSQVAIANLGSWYWLPNVTSVYSYPDGRLLNAWATGEYQALSYAWSPDGRRLAMSGNVPGEWKHGLFVVEP